MREWCARWLWWLNPFTWVPYTQAGRQSLIYLIFAGAGPALTAIVIWAMYEIRWWTELSADLRLGAFYKLARIIAWAVLLVVSALSTFVAFRALKIGKDGLEATAREDEPTPAVVAARVAGAAVDEAEQVKEESRT